MIREKGVLRMSPAISLGKLRTEIAGCKEYVVKCEAGELYPAGFTVKFNHAAVCISPTYISLKNEGQPAELDKSAWMNIRLIESVRCEKRGKAGETTRYRIVCRNPLTHYDDSWPVEFVLECQ